MNEKLLTIQEAAKKLKVSTKTLRRWEANGTLVPGRTTGAHRRYTEEQITSFIQNLKAAKTQKTTAPTPPVVPPVFQQSHSLSENVADSTPKNVTSEPAPISEPLPQSTPPTLAEQPIPVTTHTPIPADSTTPPPPPPSIPSFHFGRRQTAMLGSAVVGLILILIVITMGYRGLSSNSHVLSAKINTEKLSMEKSVLAATSRPASKGKGLKGIFNVNIPTYFNDEVYIKNKMVVSGEANFDGDVYISGKKFVVNSDISAPNVVYSINAGDGVSTSGGQDITINNTGVLSLQGRTGDVTLEAGSGITIDGTKISSTVTAPSASNSFATISDGSNSFSAGSSTDTLTFLAGTGISLSLDTTNKKVTITGTSASPVTSIGDGLELNSGVASVSLLSTGTGTGSLSSASGLEFEGGSNQLTLLQGCSNSQILKWNSSSKEWECANDSGGSSGIINVKSNNAVVTSTADTLDFGSDFTTTESPVGEINIGIDYSASHITRDNQTQTISSAWAFSGGVTLTGLSTASGTNLCVDGSNNVIKCSAGGVTSLNSLSGALTIANSTTGGSTITIDDASAVAKGIASFNSTNFSVSSGAVNTIQNINNAASPTFSGLTLSSLSTAGIVHNNASGVLSTSALNLAGGATEISGILPTTNGGTGLDTSSSTGVPSLSSGTWSIATTLATSLGGLGANVTAAGAGELLYSTGTTTYGHLAAGTPGTCLVSGGVGAPSWTSCAGATGLANYWNQTNGALSPFNSTVDFLIGAQSSSSAKFAVLNVNTTNPSASVSGSFGSTYITADGSIQTTNKQTLTLGGSTSGSTLIFGLGTGVAHSTNGVLSSGVVTNAELQNSSITVSGGTGLGVSGSPVSLGGTLTLSNTGVTSNVAGTGISLNQGTGAVTITNTGVLSVVGGTGGSALTGALTLANAQSAAGTITIDDASAVAKGIASFNSTNFSVTSGAVNTIQNINSAATPTFAGLTLSNFTGNNAVLYGTAGSGLLASATTNTAGQCLVSGGSNPTWVDCGTASGTTNYFSVSNGALYPSNLSLDLLIGGTSTNSARFALTGVATDSPVASISASNGNGIYFTNTGNVQTTNSQSLTFGGSSTGNINFSLSSPDTIQINGTSILDSSRNLSSIAGLSTHLNPTAANTYNLGTGTGNQFNAIYGNALYQNGNQVCDTSGNCIGGGTGGIGGSGNTNYVAKFSDASHITSSLLYDNGVASAFGTASPVGYVTISGGYGANAALSVNQTGAGSDIITASSSGTTRFTIDTSGNLNIIGGEFRIGGAQVLTSTGLGASVVGSSLTSVGALNSGSIASGFGTIVTTDTIQGSDITASGTTGFVSSGNDADLSFSGSGTHTISASSGALEIGAATLAGAVNGNSQNITNLGTINGLAITPNTGTITTGVWNGTVIGSQYGGTGQNFASSTGVPTLSSGTWSVSAQLSAQRGGTGIDTSSATGVPTIASGTWSTLSQLSTALGGLGADVTAAGAGELLYSTGTTTYGHLAAGSPGTCLVSNGAGAPSWTSCAGATGISTYWDQANGSLYPKNATVDFLLGGTSTSSARFAVLNVNSGTPTASVSAGLSGASYITSDGILATTNRQQLTLGSANSGNVNVFGLGTGVVHSTNGTLSTSAVTNAELQNSSITVSGGTGLGVSGSPVSLGGTLTLSNTGVTSNVAGTGISLNQGTGAVTITNTGVLSVVGGTGGSAITGALTLANSQTSGATITIDDATTAAKGIASFNSTNFSVSSGAVNTIQNIDTGAAPTFTGLTLSNFTGNNAVLYGTAGSGLLASATTNSTGQCLISGASNPTWGSCDGAGFVNVFEIANGAIRPGNTTLDLLIGGASTSSAKFAVLNVSNGTPTASISAGTTGGLFVTADGSIQTTAKQSLTLGGGNSGNVVISGLTSGILHSNASGVLSSSAVNLGSSDVTGTLSVGNGGTGVGTFGGTNTILYTTSTDTLSSISSANNAALITDGSGVPSFTIAGNDQVLRANGSGTLAFGSLDLSKPGTVGTSILSTSNGGTGFDSSASTGVAVISSGTWSALSQLSTALGGLGANVTAAGAGELLYSTSTTTYGHLAAGINGQCLASTGAGAPVWTSCTNASTSPFSSANGIITQLQPTQDILLGGVSTDTAKFAFIGNNLSRGQQTASFSGNLVLDATGSLQTTDKNLLTIGGDTTGDILFKPGNSSVGMFMRGAYVAIGNQNPQATLDVSSNSHLSAPVNKIIWGSIGTTMGILGYDGGANDEIRIGATSNVGLELITNDSVVGYFTNTGNFGVGTTNPLAKLDVAGSASVSGNITLDAAGLIETTGGQSLTLGGGTSGNLIIGQSGKTITLPGYSGQNGVLFASQTTGILSQATTASTGLCLLSGASAPSWGSCDGAASVNVFELTNGTARTTNSTVDLLVGGVSTDTAKFAITGINSARGSQVATLSGSLVLDSEGSLQTTRNQSLTIGGNTTGDILLSPRSGTGFVGVNTSNPNANLDISSIGNSRNVINASASALTDGKLLSLGATVTPVVGGTQTPINIVLTNAPTGVANTLRGMNLSINDSTDLANTLKGSVISINKSTTASNTLDITGQEINISSSNTVNYAPRTVTGINIQGTQSGQEYNSDTYIYGVRSQFASTMSDNDLGTINNYGFYSTPSISGAVFSGQAVGFYAAPTATTTNGEAYTYGFYAGNGSTNTTGLSQKTGLYIASQTGSDTNIGAQIDAAGTQTLWIAGSADSTLSSAGIAFGLSRDTNLYRGAKAQLKTDNRLFVNGGNQGGDAAFILNQNGISTNDILAASASGTTKFVIKNDGTASSSAGFTIDGAGNIQSTKNQTLTIGGNTTGNISFKPGNSSGSLFLSSNGNVGIGTANPLAPLQIDSTNSDVSLLLNGASGIFNGANYIQMKNIAGQTIGLIGDTDDLDTAFRINAVQNDKLLLGGSNKDYVEIANGMLGIGTVDTTGFPPGSIAQATLHVTRPLSLAVTGKALAIFDQLENQDIFSASSSGVAKFTITNSGGIKLGINEGIAGYCLLSGGTGAAAAWGSCASESNGNWFTLQGAQGTLFPINTTLDFLWGGTATSSAGFRLAGATQNYGTVAVASVSAKTSYAGLVVDNSGTGDILAASSSGFGRFVVKNSGNVGIGTDTPSERLTVNGNIKIESQTNSVTAPTKVTQTQSGKIVSGASTELIASISASAVFNGSLYVGTARGNAPATGGGAEIYRYKGSSGQWEAAYPGTPGQLATTTGIASISAMMVYNGNLYVGTSKTDQAEIYRYGGGTSWTRLNSSAGAIGGNTNVDGIISMAVVNGKLYIGTEDVVNGAGGGQVMRYDGGSTFTAITTTAGQLLAGTNRVPAITSMVGYGGSLFVGVRRGAQAGVYVYNGTPGATSFTLASGAVGTPCTSGAGSTSEISTLTVYNGRLYLGTVNQTNGAEVCAYQDQGFSPTSAVSTVWSRITSAAGTIYTGGTTSILAIRSMAVYNGKLYIGTDKAAAGEVYQYNESMPSSTGQGGWAAISSAAGTIASGGTSSIDKVTNLIAYNNQLFIGTGEVNPAGTPTNGGAEIYTYQSIVDQSYALKFHAASGAGGGEANGLSNDGSIWFQASSSGQLTNGANTGSFMFSHGLITNAGAYDVAEDYPTRDTDLKPGDVVEIQPGETGYVRRSTGAYSTGLIGVYSENPGFRLSQTDPTIDGAAVVPVALAGRVPVRVSTENGPIQSGDYLTSSSVPGVAMKATRGGNVIGKAMEPYTDTGEGKILAYVNASQTIGDVSSGIFAQTGMGTVGADQNSNFATFLNINGQQAGGLKQNSLGGISYTSTTTGYSEWYRKADPEEAINPHEMVCMTSTGVSKCANSNGSILGVAAEAGAVEANSAHENDPAYVLVVLVGQAKVQIKGSVTTNDSIGASVIPGAGSKVQSGYIIGTALENGSENSSDSAVLVNIQPTYNIDTLGMGSSLPTTVSANNSAASTPVSDDLTTRMTNAEDMLVTDRNKIVELIGNMDKVSDRLKKLEEKNNITLSPFSSTSGQLVTTIDELLVYGAGSFTNASIADTLQVGNSMKLTGNSINTVDALSIQSLKQGAVDIMSGAVRIETNGELTVNENAHFNKDVEVKGVLSATSINVKTAPYIELNDTEASSSAMAHTSNIKAGRTTRKIYNPNVKASSLIYITLKSKGYGLTPYVADQEDGTSFTVELENALPENLEFNYLIVN